MVPKVEASIVLYPWFKDIETGKNLNNADNPVGSEKDEEAGSGRGDGFSSLFLFFRIARAKDHTETANNDKKEKNNAGNNIDVFKDERDKDGWLTEYLRDWGAFFKKEFVS